MIASKPDPVTGNWTYPYYNSSTREYLELNTHDLYCFSSLVDCRLGFRYKDSVSGDYIEPFIAYKWINTSGIISYGSIVGNIQLGNVPIGAVELSPVYTPVPYVGTSPYPISDIYNALAEKLKTQEITFDYTDTLDQIENHTDEQLQVSQDQLLEQAQIKDLLEQIKAGQGDTTKTELQEKDLTIPETPHNLTWKFPFCVPFDLIALVGALNATPKDPKWEIPFHVESLGFNDEIELDLTKFEPVTNVLRVVTTIMFLLGLIIVTRKMIKG